MILEIQINPCARGRGNASDQISNKNAENIELGKKGEASVWRRQVKPWLGASFLRPNRIGAAMHLNGAFAKEKLPKSGYQRVVANFAASAVVAFGCLPLQSKPC
jgi:hypothetical protein